MLLNNKILNFEMFYEMIELLYDKIKIMNDKKEVLESFIVFLILSIEALNSAFSNW